MGKYTKERIIELLDNKRIEYHLQTHKAVHTMNEVESAGVIREGTVLKNLFLKDDKGKNHFLICVRENSRVDFKELEATLKVKHLGFASTERLDKYLGVESGCVSPFSILNNKDKDVKVIFDKNLNDEEIIGVHPNDSRASVWLKYKDVKRIIEDNGNEIQLLDFN